AAILLLAGFLAVAGARRTWDVVRDRASVAWPGLAVLGIGLAAGLVWQLEFGASTGIAVHGVNGAIAHAPGNYWDFTNQLVGVFGYLEYRLPRVLYTVWLAFILLLAGTAV